MYHPLQLYVARDREVVSHAGIGSTSLRMHTKIEVVRVGSSYG
jgi:UDP-N-acetylglucosamine transferase subunit ALG13